MALSAKLIAFVKNTGTGAQAVTGAGFTVKGVVLFTGANTSLTAFQASNPGVALGLLSAGSAFTLATRSIDAAVTSAASHTMAASALRLISTGAAIVAEAALTSLDSDGFTLNWTTNDGVAQTIYALCIGGADLTNVKAHTFQYGVSGSTQAITGIGFQPDAVLFVYGQSGATPPYTESLFSRISIGAMDSAGNQWASRSEAQGGRSPSNAARTFLTNSCVTQLSGVNRATFASMDADGYTLNIVGGLPNLPVIALAVKGGSWKVGATTKPTGAAPVSQAVTGVGFTPRGLLLHSVQAIVTSFSNDMENLIGAASSATARGAVAQVDRNAVNPTIAKDYSDSTKIFVKVDNGTPTVDAAADLTSFDTDGFTLSWNPNDAVATQFGYITMGDTAVAPTGGNAVFDGYYGNRPFMRGGR